MSKSTDISVRDVSLYFIPVETRVPLKFGTETLTYVTCARACMEVRRSDGQVARGWGETPLSVQWVWPGTLSYEHRHRAMKDFCIILAGAWRQFDRSGHPMGIGYAFQLDRLGSLLDEFNIARGAAEPMPYLAALVCCSLFDIALHDAYGMVNSVPTYDTYNAEYMNSDLSGFIDPACDSSVSFAGRYPADFLVDPPTALAAWHLVGGADPLDAGDLTGVEPDDGYPVLLEDWIRRDGLNGLKVKLRGDDAVWDYGRLVKVARIAIGCGVQYLTADFNCTVTDPEYVNDILDRLADEHPRVSDMILYVEQPFPYDLEANRIDVHSVSRRKPLFMDESAHDWRLVKLGRSLGWTGVALKTCKTQTGALLSLCWAKAHSMALMVQDLTNPMLAQIPHVLLAAHAGTIMGVETNAMQFYPAASDIEAKIHPGIYRRVNGEVDLSSLTGPGFGYAVDRIERSLPPVVDEASGRVN